ncbi:MAG: hypothetical protein ACREN8_11145 [Candidatus Dormibacteraceae bacterium]
MNGDVPKQHEKVLGQLDLLAHDLHQLKNQLVLDALERHLEYLLGLKKSAPDTFDLNIPVFPGRVVGEINRREIYEELAEGKLAR